MFFNQNKVCYLFFLFFFCCSTWATKQLWPTLINADFISSPLVYKQTNKQASTIKKITC